MNGPRKPTPETITPPALARRWGVAPDKIHALIQTGQLAALNLAVKPDGIPRYRILLSEIRRFEEERSTKPLEGAAR
jgi:hypothetical protein